MVNTSAVSVGSDDLTIPTPSQKGLWQRRALLLDCPLLTSALSEPRRFGMLLRQLLPLPLAELRASSLGGDVLAGVQARLGTGAHGGQDEDSEDEPTIVFVARYSVKNFFLAHFDLLQVASIVLHALGPEPRARTRLVFIPPDKANHGWWGPQRLLWASFSEIPPVSFVEWIAEERALSGAGGGGAGGGGAGGGGTGGGGAGGGGAALLPVRRAIFALSGLHSVYGRGSIGRALEGVCAPCATADGATKRLTRVSAFYRLFIHAALHRMHRMSLFQLPAPLAPLAAAAADGGGGRNARDGPWLEGGLLYGVWISRGKGLGHGYGKTVGRRCLNEPEVLQALKSAAMGLALTPLELADVPFAEQVQHFRRAAVVTGMHGAGYANIIFLAPRAVVAELCPLGYCTKSYERMSARLDLIYMRWTNTIAENAKPGYDTVVDVGQFTRLMQRAVSALRSESPAVASDEERGGAGASGERRRRQRLGRDDVPDRIGSVTESSHE